jgi:choline dehydrogenase-like flavoprotein
MFDYVIIGSGAAGATAARVLADTGASIAVLEEGPAVSTDQFGSLAYRALLTLYRDAGAQTATGSGRIPVIQGRCLGGSTVVNSAICRRIPDDVWREWDTLHGLRQAIPRAEVEAHSDRIERELQVAATPVEIWGGNNRLLSEAAARSGIMGSPTMRNAPGCQGSARCNLGCPHGAKQSMLVSYLPYAQERGAVLAAGERAERVLLNAGRAVAVRTADRDLGVAKAVLVAASAIQTPALLRRSGIRSRHLGRHFQAHPGMGVVGLFEQKVNMGSGATQGFELDVFRSEGRVKIETLSLPPETFFAGLPGVGRRWVAAMEKYGHAAVWALPLRSHGEGSVKEGRFGTRIRFELDRRDLPNLRQGLRRAAELVFSAGAAEVICPVHGLPDRLKPDQLELIDQAADDPAAYPLVMTHLFGTARMSLRPEDGVVDPRFRVHGLENLYVVDSSVFPTNLGVNPQLGIMSLAMLAAERLVA